MSSLPQRRESPRVPPPRPCFSPWLWAWWYIELGTIGLFAGYLAGWRILGRVRRYRCIWCPLGQKRGTAVKLSSIGSSLVRLFRRPATSVPPKIVGKGASTVIIGTKQQLDAMGEMLLKQVREDALLAKRQDDPFAELEAAGMVNPYKRPGIKPPLDTGTNDWTWSQWSKEAAGAGTIPGWAFCRFANRLGPESVGFVFGHVRGGFGVWRQPFDVCATTDQGIEQQSQILTCVTHLHSGMGVGIFIDLTTAVLAAELADRVCPGWETDAPERLWSAYMDRTLSAWHGLGICQSVNAHAHDQHGTRFPIYGQDIESVMAGKPERLS